MSTTLCENCHTGPTFDDDEEWYRSMSDGMTTDDYGSGGTMHDFLDENTTRTLFLNHTAQPTGKINAINYYYFTQQCSVKDNFCGNFNKSLNCRFLGLCLSEKMLKLEGAR